MHFLYTVWVSHHVFFTSAQDFFVPNSQSHVPKAVRFSCQGPAGQEKRKGLWGRECVSNVSSHDCSSKHQSKFFFFFFRSPRSATTSPTRKFTRRRSCTTFRASSNQASRGDTLKPTNPSRRAQSPNLSRAPSGEWRERDA